ncbi:MAG: Pilus retraction protein PilT [Candidatus Giovannonibacteria bacterium GW2011_GWC2_43_8]|nr:MAG: Pilus retraction protein PilT [Candidatus Giovannonibacteria bacterium GW2011_GWC2_43_8]
MTQVAEAGASDLHIAVGRHPVLRVSGQLVPLTKKPILTQADTAGLVEAMMGKEWFQEFLQNKEKDFSYSYKDKIRFRVNVYFQKGFIGAALRIVPYKIKTLEELNIPQILAEFSKKEHGFFLVVGPTGHGKSTTLAALIDLINHTRTEHIITIEDPIEYIFLPDRSMIDQREVGLDTKDFATALRSMFREDVNVAMIGEMRDHETMAAAVTAAETGHLIFSSLHTNNAAQTIDRIIDTFPGAQQGQIRTQLASTLIGIFSQRLVPRISGGLIPAYELLLSNAAVRNLIRENKVHEIDLVIETNAEVGMVSFNRSLIDLVRRGEITMENALLFSLNPQELRILAGK